MYAILLTAAIIIALLIFLQDIQFRAVDAILFILLAITGAWNSLHYTPVDAFMLNSTVNLVLVTVQCIFVLMLVRITRGDRMPVSKMIGAGDCFFLVACCLWFEPLPLLFFLVSSCMLALVLHMIFAANRHYTRNGNTVALAGWQSLAFVLAAAAGLVYDVNVWSDEWILNLVLNG